MFGDRLGRCANGLKGWGAVVGIAALLGGCANLNPSPQPLQGPQPDPMAAASPGSAAQPSVPAAVAIAAAPASQTMAAPATKVVTKTSWYRVRRGDSLQRIAQRQGCSVADLLAWNRLKPSVRLRAGQSLKLVSTQTVAVQAAGTTGADDASAGAEAAESRAVAAEVRRHAHSVTLVWPAQGPVVEAFEPGETRGIEIAGKAGDPVRAAADGKVM